MDDGHIAALNLQASRGLKAKQSAADHDSFQSWPGALQQGARVVEIAKNEHAIFFNFFDGGNKWIAPGGEQQFVKNSDAAVIASDGFCHGINVNDPNTEPEINAVLFVPIESV